MKKDFRTSGFTIVELLIGIVIFTIGILSAYLLVYTALNSSVKSKNEIIASNLARESIELLKNNRDSNWSKMLKWNKLNNSIIKHDPSIGEYITPGFYKISNEFLEDTDTNPAINIEKLSANFESENENINYILNPSVSGDKTQLCLDDKNRYTYVCSGANKPTNFYSYIKIEELKTKKTLPPIDNITVNDAFKVTATIVNSEKNRSVYSISTIITDWKK